MRSSTLYGLFFLIVSTTSSFAQSNGAGDEISEIVVTGSRLKSEFESARPTQTVSLAEMTEQGLTTIAEVARSMVTNTGSMLFNEGDETSLGTAQINLRGLGLSSSLVLINGRRGGISAATSGNGFQFLDLNQYPTIMIERMEVLTDGASALYGSEAVAGVANIITRKNFEGLEVSANYRAAENNPFDELVFGLALGKQFDGGGMSLFVSHMESQGADRSEFPFLVKRILGNGDRTQSRTTSSTGQPGSFVMAEQRPDGTYTTAAGSLRVPDPDCEAAGQFISGTTCRFNFDDQVSPIQSEKRFQAFAQFDLELKENLNAYAELSFAVNDTSGASGPSFSRNIELTGTNGVPGSALIVPASHPFNYFTEADFVAGGSTDPVDVLFIGRPLGDAYYGRPDRDDGRTGVRPGRVTENDYVRGAIGTVWDIDSNWSLDTSLVYARNNRLYSRPYDWISHELQQAVLNGRFNPFGSAIVAPDSIGRDGVTTAGNSEEILAEISGFRLRTRVAKQVVFESIVSGEAFEMSAGSVGLAAGVQYRTEDFSSDPGAIRAAAIGSDIAPELRFTGNTDVYSVFGEAVVPLWENLEMQLALRYEDFGGNTGDTLDPKIAFRYQPHDNIGLRGSWGSSFQAPTVIQLSATSLAGEFLDIPTSVDPLTGDVVCNATGISNSVSIRQLGSPDLLPQEADNFSIGVVFSTEKNFDASVDFWSYDYTNLITSGDGPQTILNNDCADDGVPNDPRIQYRTDGIPLSILTSFENSGVVKTSGVDLSLKYAIPTSRIGLFEVGAQATYVSKFDIKPTADSAKIDGAGSRNFNNAFSSVPELRANLSVNWDLGKHRLGTVLRYISDYDNDQFPGEVIEAYSVLDLHYSVSLKDFLGRSSSSLYLGVNNVADQDPPALGLDGNGLGIRPGYDDLIHDIRGRILYGGITLGFD